MTDRRGPPRSASLWAATSAPRHEPSRGRSRRRRPSVTSADPAASSTPTSAEPSGTSSRASATTRPTRAASGSSGLHRRHADLLAPRRTPARRRGPCAPPRRGRGRTSHPVRSAPATGHPAPSAANHVAVETAHQRRRDAVRLPLDEVGRGGHLVGEGAQSSRRAGGRRGRCAPRRSSRTCSPAHAEGEVGEAVPPRSPRGVAEHDGQRCGCGQARARASRPPRSRAASASGSSGSSSSSTARAGVRRVHAGRGHDRAGHRLDDPGDPGLPRPLGDDAHGAGGDGILLAPDHVRPSALETTLLDTTRQSPATQRRARLRRAAVEQQAARSAPARDLADPDHRHDGEARPRAPADGIRASVTRAPRRRCAARARRCGRSPRRRTSAAGRRRPRPVARRSVVAASAGSTSQPSRKSS